MFLENEAARFIPSTNCITDIFGGVCFRQLTFGCDYNFFFLLFLWCAWCVLFWCLSVFCSLPLSPLGASGGRGPAKDPANTPAAHHPAINPPTYILTSLPDPAGSLNQFLWELPANSRLTLVPYCWLILFFPVLPQTTSPEPDPVCLPAQLTSSLEPEHNLHSLTPRKHLNCANFQ